MFDSEPVHRSTCSPRHVVVFSKATPSMLDGAVVVDVVELLVEVELLEVVLVEVVVLVVDVLEEVVELLDEEELDDVLEVVVVPLAGVTLKPLVRMIKGEPYPVPSFAFVVASFKLFESKLR